MRDSSLIRFTLRNLGWIIASFSLALVVWIAATMENNPVEQGDVENIPIAIELPDGYVLLQQPNPATANVVVRAQQSDWDILVDEDIRITADLRDIRKPGEYRVELDAEIASPLHGKVVAIRPSALTLAVDREAEKRVAVVVLVKQEPPLGYSYPPDLACDHTEVIARGSAERVESVDHVEVRMNLSDQRNPILNETFALIAVQEDGNTARNIELIPSSVICSVDIQAREDVTQVEVLPDAGGEPPEGYIFEGYDNVEPKSVGVTGNKQAIQSMNGVVHTVSIDLTGQTETFTTEVQLVLPDGVTLVPENQRITVTVAISPIRGSREFQEMPVEITGLDTTLFRATGLANTVTVNVAGPQTLLPEREDLRVVVDLSGLPPGNHQVEPRGMIVGQGDDGLMTISVQPEQLSVTIEALDPTRTPSPTPTGEPGILPDEDLTPSPTATTTEIPVGRSADVLTPIATSPAR